MNVVVPKTISKYQNAKNAKTKLDNISRKLLSKDELALINGISDKFDVNTDASILFILNQNYGFTAEQLREFWDAVRALQKAELEANHEMATYDYIPQVQTLKDSLGIDIIAWNEEEVTINV